MLFCLAGLLGEQGQRWYDMRSQVQKDMMRPKSAFFYTDALQEIAIEFLQLLSKARDGNKELPDDTLTYLHRWSLESISRIFLDSRVGALEEGAMTEGTWPETMINQGNTFVDNLNKILFSPPFFKLYPRAFGWYR